MFPLHFYVGITRAKTLMNLEELHYKSQWGSEFYAVDLFSDDLDALR